MSRVVIDTDVVSFLFKSHPLALRYLPDLIQRTPLISFMTVAELDRWVLQARWGEARRQRLRQYLEPSPCFRTTVRSAQNGLRSQWPHSRVDSGSIAPTPG